MIFTSTKKLTARNMVLKSWLFTPLDIRRISLKLPNFVERFRCSLYNPPNFRTINTLKAMMVGRLSYSPLKVDVYLLTTCGARYCRRSKSHVKSGYEKLTPPKTNMTIAGKPTMNEDVLPIKNLVIFQLAMLVFDGRGV